MKEIVITNKDDFVIALADGHTVWCNNDKCYNKAFNSDYIYRTVFKEEGGCGMYVVDNINREWNDKDKFYYLD